MILCLKTSLKKTLINRKKSFFFHIKKFTSKLKFYFKMLNWISNYVIENKKPTNDKKQQGFPSISKEIPPASRKFDKDNQEFKLPANSKELLFKKIDDIDFNCFEYYTNSEKNGLVILTYFLFDKYSLFEKLNINSSLFVNFMSKIQKGYSFSSKLLLFDIFFVVI